ncbi:MAG: DegT/DnrJ/EryC1/StrS family aminotransferase [Candidatus Diapherotrites archaeon]|nr:DegT/DnrJ/EryC1/StrS family aminotransferase [Candidatus Diapherotrites archaeon]
MIPIAKPMLGKEELKAVKKVFDSGMLAQGDIVEKFEEKFAKYIGVDYAVATTNGTQALIMAMHCLGIKGKVAMPSFSFISTATSALAVGAKPYFIDIDERTFNIDASKIKGKFNAIIPVHLYGQACDMDTIVKKAGRAKVIEDACQAHGALWKKKKAGSFGDAAAFSFYPTKNMTTGEGGMVTTNDRKLAERMRLFRNHGQKRRYLHEYEGYNFRMTNIAAAIGLVQLKKLPKFNKQRQKNAKYYDKHLEGVETPFVLKGATHVYHQYTIKAKRRNALLNHLRSNGIGATVYYPIPIHKQPIIHSKQKLPVTEKVCKQVLSLPVYPGLKRSELRHIVETISTFW